MENEWIRKRLLPLFFLWLPVPCIPFLFTVISDDNVGDVLSDIFIRKAARILFVTA